MVGIIYSVDCCGLLTMAIFLIRIGMADGEMEDCHGIIPFV